MQDFPTDAVARVGWVTAKSPLGGSIDWEDA
jgi:hypothetical protein